jgi:GNAT superfamily N-acetyltransferase
MSEPNIKIVVRQARAEEGDAVSQILLEAARWLHDRGIALWSGHELLPQHIAADVEAGLYWLAWCEGDPAGTLRFQLEDPVSWPDASPGEAMYVHRLAVRRRFAGGQVSGAMVRWAVEETRRLGRRFLRLDCDASRPALRAIYERLGFQYHSDGRDGPYQIARYQYPCH